MKFLDRVTVTGADDSVRVDDLLKVADDYPYVEFGILMTRSRIPHGGLRVPSKTWLQEFVAKTYGSNRIKAAGHLYGSWVTNFMANGEWPTDDFNRIHI